MKLFLWDIVFLSVRRLSNESLRFSPSVNFPNRDVCSFLASGKSFHPAGVSLFKYSLRMGPRPFEFWNSLVQRVLEIEVHHSRRTQPSSHSVATRGQRCSYLMVEADHCLAFSLACCAVRGSLTLSLFAHSLAHSLALPTGGAFAMHAKTGRRPRNADLMLCRIGL